MKLIENQEIFIKIIKEAHKSDLFKKHLIANPINTIYQFSEEKLNLPDEKTLVIVDQTDDSVIHINIPHEPASKDMELSNEELDMISGGVITPPIITDPSN